MITLSKCIEKHPLALSALDIVNGIAYNKHKGMSKSYDDETYWDVGNNISDRVQKLEKLISKKKFSFSPLLKIVRKVNKRTRTIYIPTWEDKIVDKWLYTSINKILDNWFIDNCFAYRIGKIGVDKCQNNIANDIKINKFFIKRDISSYFYSIDQEILISQLSNIIDDEYILKLLKSRIKAKWVDRDKNKGECDIGVPFGTSVACLLANIHLRDVDYEMSKFNVNYYRYADDFLITSNNPNEIKLASKKLDSLITNRNLSFKESHNKSMSFEDNEDFENVSKFKHLGLEFCSNGVVRLSVEKQRKIMRLYRSIIDKNKGRLRKLNLEDKIQETVNIANSVVKDRIRSIAIIDYYLKHITDELQLKNIDRLIIELIVSSITGKKFRKGHFKIVSPKKLRNKGLISLLHRHRLHKSGKIRINFLDLRNTLMAERFLNMVEHRKERINQMRLKRKLGT